jgi:hypothetical protein
VRARDLTDYKISYLSLAVDWAGSALRRLVEAHMRGDDVIALSDARRLTKFRDLASAKADDMGFPHDVQHNRNATGPLTRFHFRFQLDALLRDQERRSKMSPREPIPAQGGEPAARIAALIRDLDQIDERQMKIPGAASAGSSTLVHDLIAMGDSAVAPLLEVLEFDNRLTRSVSSGLRRWPERFVHPVYEAAVSALIGIINTHEFNDRRVSNWRTTDQSARKALADAMRQFWQKTRLVPLVERRYRTLLDDSAGPVRWLEAAAALVQPGIPEGMQFAAPGARTMKGEPLRSGRDPSITVLMLRRSGQIERTGGDPQTPYLDGFTRACQLSLYVASWGGAASLPLLRAQMKECRARSDRWRNQENAQNADQSNPSFLAKFTEIRVKLGDLEALNEYAVWLRTTTPKMLEYGTFEAFQPLLARRDDPALNSAARWLFNFPKSPWVPLLLEAFFQISGDE